MSKSKSSRFEKSLDGRLWHPLFLAEYAAKLRDGDAASVLAWLDEAGEELQSDIDSVRLTFPDVTPAFDVEDYKRRVAARADAATLATLADELSALDEAIRSTNDQVAEAFSDDLLTGDYTLEEIAEMALKKLTGRRKSKAK
jgi:hypothetical protein